MAFKSANMAGERRSVFYLLLIALIGGKVGLAFNIWTPYIGGSFANHHHPHSTPFVVRPYPPTPFVGNPHHHTTTFIGGNGHPFLSSSGGTGHFLRTPTAVRNNISLLLPSGNVIPWWPSQGGGGGGGGSSSSDSITVGGVKIQIDRTGNKRLPATGTSFSSSKPCRTCGKTPSSSSHGIFLNPNNIHGLGSFPPRRSTSHVVVWPESTSQYSPFNVVTVERGRPNSLDYHLYFRNEDGPVSPFHDIPLFANEGNKIFNMVVEVPRWTNAKMEISTKDPLNPIKQDVKKGKLRFVANCFPHHGYIWNYGALPQTWEDPNYTDEATGCKGDNDPIDVCEIGYRVAKRGEVIQVKVLGTLALIDEGETDWKLIAIDVNDPMAPQLSDIADVEKQMPGFLKATVEWFRIYKIPDGKPENQFAFNGDAKDRDFAHKIIMETHEAWQNLVEGKTDAGGLSNTCVRISKAANKLSQAEAEEVITASPEPGPGLSVDPKVDLWHYVSLK